VHYFKLLLVFNFLNNFHNKIQYNCNLIERCLQSSGVYIEAGLSLGWFRGRVPRYVAYSREFRDAWQSV